MEIKERLQKVFRDIFDDESIELFDDRSIKLFDAMTADDIEDWDSLIHVNLIVGIEQAFNIKFTIEEVMKVKNVGELINMIKDKTE